MCNLWLSYSTLKVYPIKPHFPISVHNEPEAVFIIGLKWKQPKHPVEAVEGIKKKLWYINTMKYYSGSHKRESMAWFHLCKFSKAGKTILFNSKKIEQKQIVSKSESSYNSL